VAGVQVMLWDWLKANLPSYVTMLGLASSQGTTAAAAAAAVPPQAPQQQQQQQQQQQTHHLQQQQQQHQQPLQQQQHNSSLMLSQPLGGQAGMVLQHSLSTGNLMGGFMMA
jgi:hypothetical protein